LGKNSELKTAREHLRSLLNEKIDNDKLEAFDAKFEWITGLLSTVLIVTAVIFPIWQTYLALLGAVIAAFITYAYKYAISRRSVELRLFIVLSGFQAIFTLVLMCYLLGFGIVDSWVRSLSPPILATTWRSIIIIIGGVIFIFLFMIVGKLPEKGVTRIWKNVRVQPNPNRYLLETNIDLAALSYSLVAHMMGLFLPVFGLFIGGLILPSVWLEILVLTGIDIFAGAGGIIFVILNIVLGSVTLIAAIMVLVENRRVPKRIKMYLKTINRVMDEMSRNSSNPQDIVVGQEEGLHGAGR
jgi:hypothetical protein